MVLALRRLARTSQAWDHRVLLISDSVGSIGVWGKGRSPTWALLRLARMCAATVLICGFKPYYRYIESKRNHAGGPSRDFPIGVAPEWVEEQEKAFLRRRIERASRPRSAPPAPANRSPETTNSKLMESILTAG